MHHPASRPLRHWCPSSVILQKSSLSKDAFQRSVLNYLFKQDLLSKFTPEISQNELEKYIHIHIEEAELSLDPEAQRKLISQIIHEAFHSHDNDRKLGVMIATHSPYIINHLNVLLRAGYFEKARKSYPFIEKMILQCIGCMRESLLP